MKCEHVIHNIDAYVRGEIDGTTSERIAEHLGACGPCRREETASRRIAVGLRSMQAAAPEALARSVIAASRIKRVAWFTPVRALAACLVLGFVFFFTSRGGELTKPLDLTATNVIESKTGPAAVPAPPPAMPPAVTGGADVATEPPSGEPAPMAPVSTSARTEVSRSGDVMARRHPGASAVPPVAADDVEANRVVMEAVAEPDRSFVTRGASSPMERSADLEPSTAVAARSAQPEMAQFTREAVAAASPAPAPTSTTAPAVPAVTPVSTLKVVPSRAIGERALMAALGESVDAASTTASEEISTPTFRLGLAGSSSGRTADHDYSLSSAFTGRSRVSGFRGSDELLSLRYRVLPTFSLTGGAHGDSSAIRLTAPTYKK